MFKKIVFLLLLPFYLWGVVIDKDIILTKDVVYDEDVVIDGATLTLNNHIMIVNGDFKIIGDDGKIKMVQANDKLTIKGDAIFSGASSKNFLIDGVIELSGDLNQTTRYSFTPTNNHKVILNGNNKQVIHFEFPYSSYFNHLEIRNLSVDGVVFNRLNVMGKFKTNKNTLNINNIINLTLSENYTISNNVDIESGILDLNGHILTINGNLRVLGEYGRLKMNNLNDKLIINGDLTFHVGITSYGYLTNGVIELTGDFNQIGSTYYSFYGYDSSFSTEDFIPPTVSASPIESFMPFTKS